MKSKKEPITTQEVFILQWKGEGAQNSNLSVLNGRLKEGWRIQSATSMGNVGQDHLTACCAFCLIKG